MEDKKYKNIHLRRIYTEKGEDFVKESLNLSNCLKEKGAVLVGNQGATFPRLGRDWHNIASYGGCTIIYCRDYSPTAGLNENFCRSNDLMGFSLSVMGDETLVQKVLDEIESMCPLFKDKSISRREKLSRNCVYQSKK